MVNIFSGSLAFSTFLVHTVCAWFMFSFDVIASPSGVYN